MDASFALIPPINYHNNNYILSHLYLYLLSHHRPLILHLDHYKTKPSILVHYVSELMAHYYTHSLYTSSNLSSCKLISFLDLRELNATNLPYNKAFLYLYEYNYTHINIVHLYDPYPPTN